MSNSKLTAADLAKLAEGATKGPWEPNHPIRASSGWTVSIDVAKRCHLVAQAWGNGTSIGEGNVIASANAALIVYLVNHVPEILALLGENERLREVERAARELRARDDGGCPMCWTERFVGSGRPPFHEAHCPVYALDAALAALGKEEA